MALPAGFLDELRARTPLAVLIGRRVKLSKSGHNWKGCCPFDGERSPSFHVYDDHFHCFGCGAHGDAISFVMQSEGVSFPEAVERLAKDANLVVPKTEPEIVRNTAKSASPVRPTGPTPREERIIIANNSTFTEVQLESILATAAKLLVRGTQVTSASILANASGRLIHWEHDNWNGGQETWRLSLAIPADVYSDLEGREDREKEINVALGKAMETVSDADTIFVKIVVALDEDPNWRQKVIQHVTGEGLTNQGRVRSGNIAAIENDGLLFRSRPEVHFYNALKRIGVPFAPLSVVLHGGIEYRRVEPDFVIYREGAVMIVEIDGDLYHRETPAEAHARLKFMIHEGINLERIEASECDTADKAREAVDRILATMDKLRKAR